MFKRVVPIDRRRHANTKIKPLTSFSFAENSYIASIMTNEFNRAASTYPIVFLKDEDHFRPFVLLGLKQDENLFVDEEGRWQANYVPAIIRRYPFVLSRRSSESDEFTVCIDEESGVISEDEGTPMFGDDGEPGEILENAKKYLTELQQMSQLSSTFCRELEDRELLTPLNMQIKEGEATQNIAGCFAINEKKLTELDDEVFLTLRKRGALPLIYSHLTSLGQIERLIKLRQERKN